RARWAIFLWPLTFVSIPASFQRDVILALFMGFMIVWLQVTRSLPKIAGALAAATLATLMVTFDVGDALLQSVGATLGGEVRPDYLSTSTLDARSGYQLRGADLFVYVFPAGVGPSMVPWAMNDPAVQSVFAEYASPQSRVVYDTVVEGTRTTAVHC